MNEAFLTITEAVKYTSKSRRTLHRLAQHLEKTAPDHVMREKTDKGVIWRIHKLALPPVTASNQSVSHERNQPPSPLPALAPTPCEEQYLAMAQQGYGSLMTMHHEVKVTYEALLHEKELRIQALTQALDQRRRGFWQRFLGW